MTYQSENRALKRLSQLTWKEEGTDDFVTMQGYFTPRAAEELMRDLGEVAREALGFCLIANHTKIMLRRSLTERVFQLEGLSLNMLAASRGR